MQEQFNRTNILQRYNFISPAYNFKLQMSL